MVFKKNVILERLTFLRETLAELRLLKNISYDEVSQNKEKQWAIEHGLHFVLSV